MDGRNTEKKRTITHPSMTNVNVMTNFMDGSVIVW